MSIKISIQIHNMILFIQKEKKKNQNPNSTQFEEISSSKKLLIDDSVIRVTLNK